MVCLICLEFTPLLGSDSQLNRQQSPQTNNVVNITPKFVKFCKTFLQTEVSGGKLWKECNPKKGGLYFCRDCEVLVKNVLRLHSELNERKARLLWKVNELRMVIKSSQSKSGGEGMGNNFEHLTTSSKQVEMEKLRKDLVNKCTEKCRRIFPFVILNKNVKKCEKGRGSNVFVPAKPHLDFVISFIIVLALKRNWSLREIASYQTDQQTAHSKSSVGRLLPIKLECSDSEEISSTNENIVPEESEPDNTFEHEDSDRNSDIGMDFSEVNFDELEDITSPADLPNPTPEDDEQLPKSKTEELNVTLKRRRGRPKKELGSKTGCEIAALPSNSGGEEFVSDVTSISAGGPYGLRKRSMTKISQKPDDSGDDNKESDQDQGGYQPPPRRPRPRLVRSDQRQRKLKTKGLVTKRRTGRGVPLPSGWKCKVCNKCFTVRIDLESHKKNTGHLSRTCPPNWLSLGLAKPQQVYKSKCVVCGEHFSQSCVLFNHLVYKHNGGPDKLQLICRTCDLKTRSVSELKKHLRETHENPDEKSHFCPHCAASYTTSQCLELHRRLDHWKLPPLFCDDNDCSNTPFFFVEDLNSHMREDPFHQNREIFNCKGCNRGFFSNFHRRLHQLKHIGRCEEEGLLQCPEETCCNKYRHAPALLRHYNNTHFPFENMIRFLSCKKGHRFLTFSKGELDFHMKMSHEDNLVSKHLNCDVCNIHFPSHCSKIRHMATLRHLQRTVEVEDEKLGKTDQGEEDEPNTSSAMELLINCASCEEKFTSKAKLHLHRKLAHPNQKSKQELTHKSDIICELCAKSFSSKHSLQRHMIVHEEPQLQCPHCSKFYGRDYALKLHINRKHTKKEMVVCEVCGKACVKSEYNYHKSEHLLLHCCHLCPKKFSRAWSLKGHMRVHTGEKLQCEWCPVTYAALDNMKSHVKVAHPEEYLLHYGTKDHRTKLRFKIVNPTEADEGDAGMMESNVST